MIFYQSDSIILNIMNLIYQKPTSTPQYVLQLCIEDCYSLEQKIIRTF